MFYYSSNKCIHYCLNYVCNFVYFIPKNSVKGCKMKRTISRLFLSSLLIGTMSVIGMSIPTNAIGNSTDTSASREGVVENQKDYSTSEAAMEYLSFNKIVKNIETTNPELAVYIADKLEKQALGYTDEYAKERIAKIKKLYSERFGSFDSSVNLNTAQEIENYVNKNWSSWIVERKKLVEKKIDDVANASALYAVLVAANDEAYVTNAETAKKIVADLPQEERAYYEAIADEMIKYDREIVQPLIAKGMPAKYADVPNDWNAISEDELSAAVKEADRRGMTQKNDTIIGLVTKARNKSVKLPPITFASKTMKKLFGNWFDNKHPYYLNDMMRNVLPKLDSDMQKLENETIVVPIPKAKTDLHENGKLLEGFVPTEGMNFEDNDSFVSKANKQGKYTAKAVLLPKAIWSGIETVETLMNDPTNSELRTNVLAEITKPYREIKWEIKAKKPIVQPKQPAGNNNINDKNANNNKNGAGKNIIALPITGSDILSLGTIALILLVSGALIVSNKSKNKI